MRGACAAPFVCSFWAGAGLTPRGTGPLEKPARPPSCCPRVHFLSCSAGSFALLFGPPRFPSVSGPKKTGGAAEWGAAPALPLPPPTGETWLQQRDPELWQDGDTGRGHPIALAAGPRGTSEAPSRTEDGGDHSCGTGPAP